jgi:hypothetical protein
MKSVIQEASTLSKAIEQGWVKAGKPALFSIKIVQEPSKNFIGLTTQNAKIVVFFGRLDEPATQQMPQLKQYEPQQQSVQQKPQRDAQQRQLKPQYQQSRHPRKHYRRFQQRPQQQQQQQQQNRQQAKEITAPNKPS